MMAAQASFLAASCASLKCPAVLHSTDKSARRNSRPVSKRSHEKARKAAELTCGGVYASALWLHLEIERHTAYHREDQEAESEKPWQSRQQSRKPALRTTAAARTHDKAQHDGSGDHKRSEHRRGELLLVGANAQAL
jgi:hypothetical protein